MTLVSRREYKHILDERIASGDERAADSLKRIRQIDMWLDNFRGDKPLYTKEQKQSMFGENYSKLFSA